MLGSSHGRKQVHLSTCKELQAIIDRTLCLIPEIEAARPGFMSGISELCSLINSIDKARSLVDTCSHSSKLYLAIKGETIIARCERIRTSIHNSLTQIQTMVPEPLASQISDSIHSFRAAKFFMDSSDDQARKILLALLRCNDATKDYEFKAFRQVASTLQLTSPRALLVEKRRIHKLLQRNNTAANDKNIFNYLLSLLRTYGTEIHKQSQSQNPTALNDFSHDPTSDICENFTIDNDEVQWGFPPENYLCPVSRNVMHDPVIIASGKTYERACIEKWFSEGHDTCPQTQIKLSSLFTIPNSSLKDLISQWRRHNHVILQHPCGCCAGCGAGCRAFKSRISASSSNTTITTTSLNSISSVHSDNRNSFTSNGSNTSTLIQYDDDDDDDDDDDATTHAGWASYSSQATHTHNNSSSNSSKVGVHRLFTWSAEYQQHRSFSGFNQDSYSKFLSQMSRLPAEDNGKVLEDFNHILTQDYATCSSMLSNGFFESLSAFLNNSSDIIVNKPVLQFLLTFLKNHTNSIQDGIASLSEDAVCCLLTCFKHSSLHLEELMVVRALCSDQTCKHLIVASGVTNFVMEKLDSRDSNLTELALDILYKLSPIKDMVSLLLSSPGCLSNLISLLHEKQFSIISLTILQNLCNTEDGQTAFANNDGLATVSELLEYGSSKDEQAMAVSLLLALCICSSQHCDALMKEGVIPSLVDISVNGSDQGKKDSNLLLRLLRDHGTYATDISSAENSAVSAPEPPSPSVIDNVAPDLQTLVSSDSGTTSNTEMIHTIQYTKKKNSKRSRFFGRIFFPSRTQ